MPPPAPVALQPRERAGIGNMSWQPSLCQEVGEVVARLLGGAVLLCVVSNAVFLFYLPSRRSRAADGQCQAQRTESRQAADTREGGQASQRASPAEQRSEAPSTDRRRSTAGQRSGSDPNGRLGPAATQPEQRRKPVVLFIREQQFPGRASQAGGSLWPPVPDRPLAQAVDDARRSYKAGLEESGSLPRQRSLVAAPRRGQ